MNGIILGMTFKIDQQIKEEHAASAIGSGALHVFSTPSMIALMEKASMLCVESNLEETETTVGIAVDIEHKKATAVGSTVVCESRVIGVDGRKIDFEVKVRENGVLVGEGNHTRFVVDKERFMSSL